MPPPPPQITDCFCTFASASYSGSDPECGCRRVLDSGRDGRVIVCQSLLCSVRVWAVGVCVLNVCHCVYFCGFFSLSFSVSLSQHQDQLSEILKCCCTLARGLLYPSHFTALRIKRKKKAHTLSNKRTTRILAK